MPIPDAEYSKMKTICFINLPIQSERLEWECNFCKSPRLTKLSELEFVLLYDPIPCCANIYCVACLVIWKIYKDQIKKRCILLLLHIKKPLEGPWDFPLRYFYILPNDDESKGKKTGKK